LRSEYKGRSLMAGTLRGVRGRAYKGHTVTRQDIKQAQIDEIYLPCDVRFKDEVRWRLEPIDSDHADLVRISRTLATSLPPEKLPDEMVVTQGKVELFVMRVA